MNFHQAWWFWVWWQVKERAVFMYGIRFTGIKILEKAWFSCLLNRPYPRGPKSGF
jgi:hypothetical protein